MIPWLVDAPEFPPVELALDDPPGLLAAGGALTPEWLLAAYRRGIFPWYSEGQPILWWSLDPRLVLYPTAVRVSRSLGKTLRRNVFDVRFDTAFADVVAACAAPRQGASGTWITPEMQRAYITMHELGHAHSVEAWQDGKLLGGLYGMALGSVFFGESMFSHATDASKVCLAHLARRLEALNFAVIDCQMTTAHLVSLGACEIPRAEFCRLIDLHADDGPPPGHWPAEATAGLFKG
jgi:leucyl/phenylalanyl-tRNA---protein transferase